MLDLRKRIFLHTQRLSLEFHESYTSGRIISRQTSDLDTIRELLDGGLNELVSGVLYGAFTLVALFLIDWQSGLIVAVMGIPLALLMRWFYMRSQVAYRESRVVSAKVIVKFVETMTGIRAVKAFRKEVRNDDEFGELASDYRDVNMRTIRLFGTFEPGLIAISAVSVVAGAAVGRRSAWSTGRSSSARCSAAVLYVRNFFSPLQEVAFFLNSYQSATAALEKVSGVLEEEPTVPDPAKPVDLWTGARPRPVRRRARSGTRTTASSCRTSRSTSPPARRSRSSARPAPASRRSPSSCRGSTTRPSGSVTLDGVDLRSLHPKDLRRAIVMVTQEAYLFSGTVADNIALGKPDATLDEIQAAARAVGADAFIERLPDGYATDVNKRGGRVSAGQRQLISFARAFLANPSVLILDEATASLDIPSERMIQDALQTLLADRTAIIIAHRLSTVAIADRVLVMEHGRIIEDDSPENLIGGDGRFAKLHAAWRESLV